MKQHPTKLSDEDFEVAREAWEATARLVDTMLDSAAREDAAFVGRLKGAFHAGGVTLRTTIDFHGDGRVTKIQLSSMDGKGQLKTVSEATFKTSPSGQDTLQ